MRLKCSVLKRLTCELLLFCAAVWTAQAQDPVQAFPNNYKLAFENSEVTMIHVHYGPHEKVGVHDHSRLPTVYVYLSDSPPVRFSHDEKPPFALTRPPVKAGAFRVSPGRLERHSVENLGDSSSDFLRVELKKTPLGGVQPFRAKAPSLTRDSRRVEVQEPGLRVERLVCTGENGPCAIDARQGESLLIALTPLHFSAGTRGGSLKGGELAWVDAKQINAVPLQGRPPAHLLLITLDPSGKEPSSAK